MAQLTRALQKIFGSAGGTSEFGQIGSKAAGAAATTKDLELMQALTEYDDGLAAIISDQGTTKLPYLQDINSLFYLTTSQLAYLMQSGVPEWDDDTEYYQDVSIVLRNGILYKDIYGTGGTPNLNYAPESNLDKWKAVAAAIDVVSLVDGANISNDASEGSVFTVTIGGDRIFDNWTNKLIGREYTLIITQDGTGNWNPTFDTDFVFYGNNVINQSPGSVTIIKCITVSSSIVSCFIAGAESKAIDFSAKNLLINITGVDTLVLTADAIQYINSSGETREEFGPISDSWTPSTDIIGGESGTDSQWLQAWRDSDGLMKLTLCEEGSATGTTTGYLVSSSNTLYSRGAVAGDYLYNMTDLTSTRITTTPTANGQDIAVDDDIFVNGDDYKLVKNTAPSVMGDYAACLGFALQDATPDLIDSGYTKPELQKIITYSQQGGEYSLSNSGATYYGGTNIIFQTMKFGQTPQWRGILEAYFEHSSTSSGTITQTGVTFKNISTYRQYCILNGNGVYPTENYFVSGGNTIIYALNSATARVYINSPVLYEYKPAFATRS